jgi:hypothetical protein
MKRARARIKLLTARSQVGPQLEDVIKRLNLCRVRFSDDELNAP